MGLGTREGTILVIDSKHAGSLFSNNMASKCEVHQYNVKARRNRCDLTFKKAPFFDRLLYDITTFKNPKLL